MRPVCLLSLPLLAACASAYGATYHVTTTGSDAENRSGLETSQAWRSLAYACSRVPAGAHVIRMHGGTFVADDSCRPAAGITIRGNGSRGAQRTVLKPAATSRWDFSGAGCTAAMEGFLVSGTHTPQRPLHDVTIEAIEFIADPGVHANGAIAFDRANRIHVRDVKVSEFRHSGINLDRSLDSVVEGSELVNTATNRICDASRLGSLSTRWVGRLVVRNNLFRSTRSAGYGYRGRGHDGAKIHGNVFEMHDTFAIEVAHGVDFGVEIYDNVMNATVSAVKSSDVHDAPARGWPYAVRIHDNIITHDYAVEGSRRYLEVDHNYFLNSNGNGANYMDHGTPNSIGPVSIHHNVSVGVGLAFFHKNGDGDGDNFSVYNNTVFMSSMHNNRFLDFFRDPVGDNYRVFNNIVVGPAGAPERRARTGGGGIDLFLSHNVHQRVTGMPEGNIAADPGLLMAGSEPAPYYLPASAASAVVDAGLPRPGRFLGSASDIGAYEFGVERIEAESLPHAATPGVATSVWNNPQLSDGGALVVDTTQPGQSITFRLPSSLPDGSYGLRIGMRNSVNRAIWQASRSATNGIRADDPFAPATERIQQRFPIDGYASSPRNEEVDLGEFITVRGFDQLLTLAVLGKSAESSGHQMVVDYILLEPRAAAGWKPGSRRPPPGVGDPPSGCQPSRRLACP